MDNCNSCCPQLPHNCNLCKILKQLDGLSRNVADMYANVKEFGRRQTTTFQLSSDWSSNKLQCTDPRRQSSNPSTSSINSPTPECCNVVDAVDVAGMSESGLQEATANSPKQQFPTLPTYVPSEDLITVSDNDEPRLGSSVRRSRSHQTSSRPSTTRVNVEEKTRKRRRLSSPQTPWEVQLYELAKVKATSKQLKAMNDEDRDYYTATLDSLRKIKQRKLYQEKKEAAEREEEKARKAEKAKTSLTAVAKTATVTSTVTTTSSGTVIPPVAVVTVVKPTEVVVSGIAAGTTKGQPSVADNLAGSICIDENTRHYNSDPKIIKETRTTREVDGKDIYELHCTTSGGIYFTIASMSKTGGLSFIDSTQFLPPTITAPEYTDNDNSKLLDLPMTKVVNGTANKKKQPSSCLAGVALTKAMLAKLTKADYAKLVLPKKDGKFGCAKCFKTFTIYSNALAHYKDIHLKRNSLAEPWKCLFPRSVKGVVKNVDQSCYQQCESICTDEKTKENHLRIKHQKRECPFCKVIFDISPVEGGMSESERHELEAHGRPRRRHNKKLKLINKENDGLGTATKKLKTAEVEAVTVDETFVLPSHCLLPENDKDGKFGCVRCFKPFSSWSHLLAHHKDVHLKTAVASSEKLLYVQLCAGSPPRV